MGEIQCKVSVVVGPTDHNHWGQTLVTPEVYGVVEVVTESGGARSVGVGILAQLTQVVSGGQGTIRDIDELLFRYSKIAELATVCLIYPIGKRIYVTMCGEGIVFVKRGDQVAVLLSATGSVSGEVKGGDVLFLVSRRASRTLTHAELAQILRDADLTQIAEKLTLLLHKKHDGLGSSALVLEIQEGNGAQIKPVVKKSGFRVPKRVLIFRERIIDWLFKLKGMMLRRETWRSRRFLAGFISVILVGVFLVSVLLGLQRQSVNGAEAQLRKDLLTIQQLIDEGVALSDLNQVKARERLREAKAMLEANAPRVTAKTELEREYKAVGDNLALVLPQVERVTEVTPGLFFDATLLRPQATVSSFAKAGEKLLLLDGLRSAVYEVDSISKQARVVSGGESLKGGKYISATGLAVYVWTPEGIMEIPLSGKVSVVKRIPKSEEWVGVVGLQAYGGNLYLLDSGKQRIWKYIGTETGFSTIKEFLNADSFPDLSGATSWAIDGTVWVSGKDGRVKHFVQGQESTFVVKGVEPELGNDVLVYTDDELVNLYILNTAQGRLVEVDKDGLYVAQYRFTSALSVSEFVVDGESKRAFFLSGGKIYVVNLK